VLSTSIGPRAVPAKNAGTGLGPTLASRGDENEACRWSCGERPMPTRRGTPSLLSRRHRRQRSQRRCAAPARPVLRLSDPQARGALSPTDTKRLMLVRGVSAGAASSRKMLGLERGSDVLPRGERRPEGYAARRFRSGASERD
jgi:hypothetical protein